MQLEVPVGGEVPASVADPHRVDPVRVHLQLHAVAPGNHPRELLADATGVLGCTGLFGNSQ
jgi:hypothetical protein